MLALHAALPALRHRQRTSTVARPAGARPRVMVEGSETRVLVEQVVAVGTDRLGAVIARLEADEMWAVDDALSFVLGLD